MAKGRKPKPAALKLLQGNPGKRPIKDSVKFPVDILPAPDFLQGYALAEWDRMEPIMRGIGVLTVADCGALTAYCTAYGEMREAESELAKLPRKDRIVTVGPDGRITRNLISRVRDEARRDMVKYAAEMGMTPASRNKVTPASKPAKGNKFTLLTGSKPEKDE